VKYSLYIDYNSGLDDPTAKFPTSVVSDKAWKAAFGSEQIQGQTTPDQTGRFRRLLAIGQDGFLATCTSLLCLLARKTNHP
jgi:hypothetical protein